MSSAEIAIANLNKSFGGTHVLRDVSLTVRPGSFVSILGPSGCGKSTLLRILAGLESADSGSVAIGGVRVEGVSAKDRGIAFVFQSYALYPHLTVRGNIAAPLVMRELSGWQRLPLARTLNGDTRRKYIDIAAQVDATAKLLAISELMDRKPGQLSGGQRQRVALGRALVREPRLFLMDEPLANLDAGLRVQMRSEIGALQRRLGATTLFVTHDHAEAFAMSDQVAIMFGGRIRQFDTPDRLYEDPAEIDVARFLSQPHLNVLETQTTDDGRVVAGERELVIDDVRSYRGKGSLAFRPDQCTIVAADHADALPAVVERVEYAGSETHVFLKSPLFVNPATVRMDSRTALGLRPGSSIGVQIDRSAAWFFPQSGPRPGRRDTRS